MATKMTREEAINKVRQMNLPKETMEILQVLAPELRPSWKPNEEQMNALLNAEGFLRAGLQHDSAKTIAELYEQLKKL